MAETPTKCIYEEAFAKTEKTDAILVVDGKKLHINKALLSNHSDYFNTLFNSDFKEKSMEEIPIDDVIFEDFATVLSLVHPNPLKPTIQNAEKLLELADRFLLPNAKRHLELFFMTTKFNGKEKIRIADKFQLEDLFTQALTLYTAYTDLKGYRADKTFQAFSDSCKARLLVRLLELLNI